MFFRGCFYPPQLSTLPHATHVVLMDPFLQICYRNNGCVPLIATYIRAFHKIVATLTYDSQNQCISCRMLLMSDCRIRYFFIINDFGTMRRREVICLVASICLDLPLPVFLCACNLFLSRQVVLGSRFV